MPAPEIRPFEASDLADAGRLLADRHRRHRLAQPLLSPTYERAAAAEAEVAELLKSDSASGSVALLDGEVVGFLLGAPKTSEVWGPNVWVEAAGQAATEAEMMRDLYAAAAARWVAEGRTAQYVLVPATDHDLVRAWSRLGFGQQHAHGIREVPTGPAPAPPPGITIRRPRREDIPVLARLDLELPNHQGLAPTFSAGHASSYDEAVAEWEEDFDNEAFTTFVAEYDGEVIGAAVGSAIEMSGTHQGLCRADGASLLGFAAVFPSARSIGAGRALGEAYLAWTSEAGFSCAVTDWRVTNLLSSRAWPALGFEESFLRMHRLIGY
jgi:GNAT superfamily N-acetyltransferase